MHKLLLVTPLGLLILVIMTILSGGSQLNVEQILGNSRNDLTTRDNLGNESSCHLPGEAFLTCKEMEQRILSTTLRIKIETWLIHVEGKGYASLSSNGHGTVMNGRYLLTHNHFDLPLLELLADDFNGQFATITLYSAAGSMLWQGPLTTASIAFDDSETLLIEVLISEGQGLFESLDIPSADFATRDTLHLSPGAMMAQVNWDGEQAFVQWTQVEEVLSEAGTPVMQLANCIRGGSSGGGVFLDGEHIANNWSRSNGCVEQSRFDKFLYSKAALNSKDLIGFSRPNSAIVSTQ